MVLTKRNITSSVSYIVRNAFKIPDDVFSFILPLTDPERRLSLNRLELVMELEEMFNLEIDEDKVWEEWKIPQDILNYVLERVSVVKDPETEKTEKTEASSGLVIISKRVKRAGRDIPALGIGIKGKHCTKVAVWKVTPTGRVGDCVYTHDIITGEGKYLALVKKYPVNIKDAVAIFIMQMGYFTKHNLCKIDMPEVKRVDY